MQKTIRDLELEYLRDTGLCISSGKIVEVSDTITPKEISIKVSCPECKATFFETEYPEDEEVTIEYDADSIDEEYHNWCIEKLLEYKNKENEKDI